MKNKSAGIITIILIIAFSCKRKHDASWDADYSVPLGKASLTVNDLLADSLLSLNPDNSLNLVIDYNLLRFSIDSLIEIPDTILTDAYTLPFPFPLTANPGQNFISNSSVTRYNLSGAELKEAELKTGVINYSIKNPLPEKVVCTFSISGAINTNGQPFLRTITASAAVNGISSNTSGSFSISGYNIDLRGPYGDDYNTIVSNTSFKIVDDGNPTLVTNQDTLYFTYSFESIRPQYVYGYFGNFNQQIGPSETNFSLFNNFISGLLDIDQVSVRLDIINGIGADARINIQSLYAKNSQNSSQVNLTHNLIGNSQNINRAFRSGNNISPSTHQYLLDNTNSNIDLLIENLPDKLGYEAFFQLNPFGNVSGNNDFAHADYPFEINLLAELPLRFIANDLTLQRDFVLNITDIERFNSARLKIKAVNTFPFKADLWVYLLDNTGNVADSVLAAGIINAGVLDFNNIVQSPGTSEPIAVFNKPQLELLQNNKKIRIKAVFNTVNQTQHQNIYNYYKLDLDIRADFNYTMLLN
ncbi:MAG: hypothetical protein ACK4K0_10820 [Flavobacteriales bacterium]